MVAYYLYAITIPVPQICYVTHLRCHIWLPAPSQPPRSTRHLATAEHSWPTWCREFSALQRVSGLVLCFSLWGRQKPVPKDSPWGSRAESSVSFLWRIILAKLCWENSGNVHTLVEESINLLSAGKKKIIIIHQSGEEDRERPYWSHSVGLSSAFSCYLLDVQSGSLNSAWFTGVVGIMVCFLGGTEVTRLELPFIQDQNQQNKICLNNKMCSTLYGHINPKHATELSLGTGFSGL